MMDASDRLVGCEHSSFHRVPFELVTSILEMLPSTPDRVRAQAVCKHWKQLLKDDCSWEAHYFAEFGGPKDESLFVKATTNAAKMRRQRKKLSRITWRRYCIATSKAFITKRANNFVGAMVWCCNKGHDAMLKAMINSEKVLSMDDSELKRMIQTLSCSTYWLERGPLIIAAASGNIPLIERLLGTGMNINTYNRSMNTPLRAAVKNRRNDMVTFIMSLPEHNLDEDMQLGGINVFHLAAFTNNEALLQTLHRRAVAEGSGNIEEMFTSYKWATDSGGGPLRFLGARCTRKVKVPRRPVALDECTAAWRAPLRGSMLEDWEGKREIVTPLQIAALRGHHRVVDVLLSKFNAAGGDLRLRKVLNSAARENHTQTVKVLMDSRADINAVWRETEGLEEDCMAASSTIHYAAYFDNLELLKMIVSTIPKEDSESAIRSAPGALSPAAIGETSCSAEEMAAYKEKNSRQSVANVNLSNGEYGTPLHTAIVRNHKEAALLLMDAGARLDDLSLRRARQTDINPAVAAVYAGRKSVLELLKKKGIPFDKKRKNLGANQALNQYMVGTSPLVLACEKGDLELVEWIIDRMGDPEDIYTEPMGQNITPLLAAVCTGRKKMVSYLLENGADVNGVQTGGPHQWCQHCHCAMMGQCSTVPLVQAVAWNQTSIAQLLLNKRAKVQAKGCKHGTTALHAATKSMNTELVQLLLKHRANPNVKDTLGKTPIETYFVYHEFGGLDVKLEEKRLEVIRLLLYSGASPKPLKEYLKIDPPEFSALWRETESLLAEVANVKRGQKGSLKNASVAKAGGKGKKGRRVDPLHYLPTYCYNARNKQYGYCHPRSEFNQHGKTSMVFK